LHSSHATNSYAVLPTALTFVHATSDKYKVRNQALRTLHFWYPAVGYDFPFLF